MVGLPSRWMAASVRTSSIRSLLLKTALSSSHVRRVRWMDDVDLESAAYFSWPNHRGSSMEITDAVESDLPAITAIYNDVIRTSTAVFNDAPVSVEDRIAW